MPFNIGVPELLLILAVALLVIGPGRLPDVGAALGKSLREFRKASTEVQDAVSSATTQVKSATAATTPAAAVPASSAAVAPAVSVAPIAAPELPSPVDASALAVSVDAAEADAESTPGA